MDFTAQEYQMIRHPFLETLGVEYVSHAKSEGTFKLQVEEKHLRSFGILHGGVICSLLDTTMGLAAMTVAEEGKIVVTSQMNLHFVRPCRQGETIFCTAKVKHGGRQTVVVEGEIRTEGDDLVSVGTGTYMYATV